jgi:hypothetical protein
VCVCVCVCSVWITAYMYKFDPLLISRDTFGRRIEPTCSSICNSWQKVKLVLGSNSSHQHNFCLSYRLCMLHGSSQDINWTCNWAFCFLLGQHITCKFPWTKFLSRYRRIRHHNYDNLWSEVAQSDVLRNKARSRLLDWPVPFETGTVCSLHITYLSPLYINIFRI